MQIASQEDIGESIKAIKWLRENKETALQKHGTCVLISIWSWLEVLKTRREILQKQVRERASLSIILH